MRVISKIPVDIHMIYEKYQPAQFVAQQFNYP